MGETHSLPPSLPVLVATTDSALQEVLADLLAEESYVPCAASSIAEALALTEERAFSMILAEVFSGTAPHAWDEAQTLLRRAYPAPVGLLVTHSHVPDAAMQAGFAFVQHMPFEIDELLARVASATARPLTPQQQRWRSVVERYCAAFAAADWDTLLDLLSDDVIYYPPSGSPVTSQRRLEGKAAVRSFYEAAAAVFRRTSCSDLSIYPRSRGLTARLTGTWLGEDDQLCQAAITLRLRFDGDRIRQVGVRVNLARTRVPVRSYPA